MLQNSPLRVPRWVGTVLVLGWSFTACAANPTGSNHSGVNPAGDRPKVVATASVLCNLTEQIAQDTIDLTCLSQPGVDPHVYKPTPSDRRSLEDADLILYSGYQYEPSILTMVQATNTAAPKVAVFEQAVPKPLMAEAHEHAGEDHSEAHPEAEAHAEDEADLVADPHIWHDPSNGIKMTEAIANELADLVPAQESLYRKKAEAIATQLQAIDRWIQTQVDTIPNTARKLVTPHNSFGYYAHAYGLEVKGTLEGLSTDERPSATQLAEVVDLVKQANVPTIFGEQTTNPQLIETVAKDANVKVAATPLYVEGPGTPDSSVPTYQAMLISNTCTIVEGLGGKCDRTKAPS